MKWLFIMFVLQLDNGELRPKVRTMSVFASEAGCNAYGNDLANRLRFDNRAARSFSTCIPQSAFAMPDGKVEMRRLVR